MIDPRLRQVSGAVVEGFTTSVLPVTSAGPTFQPMMIPGTFHGMMAPQMPIGFLIVTPYRSFPTGTSPPRRLAEMPA
jgi:hypothetical protein